MSDERRLRARARALRAARVVTLASSLVSCSSRSDAPAEDAGLDAALVDASSGDSSVVDASMDAGVDAGEDATVADAGFDAASDDAGTGEDAGEDAAVADAGFDAAACTDFPPTTPECCAAADGFWEEDRCIVAVPGPFVPPRMV
ncbi:MAG: hypothetical protein MUE69_07360 [Myxococcota bacterium]|nr:hypothetical protein [Myxococcota bacterium]